MRKIIPVLILLTIAAIFGVSYFTKSSDIIAVEDAADTTASPVTIKEIKASKYKYGLALDSFDVSEEKLNKKEKVTDVISTFDLSEAQKSELAKQVGKNTSVNNLTGKKYFKFYSKNNQRVECLVFDLSYKDQLVINPYHLPEAYVYTQKVDTVEREVTAEVKTSLYEALADANAPTELSNTLANIFSRKVDFFRLGKGDKFQIIYKELQVEGKPVKAAEVKAACYIDGANKYYAFRFVNNGKADFYDEKGNNLSSGGFLKAPLKYFRITSKFSKNRFHPVQKIFKAHLGTDYAAPTGTPIMTTAAGTVVEAKYSQFNGNYVKVKHNDTYSTQYLHMSKIAKSMRPGLKVKQGEVIGYVGSTGLASGPHVCYRFWQNGKQVDPSKVKITFTGTPVPKNKLGEFNKTKEELMNSFEKINQDSAVEASQ